MWRGSGGNCSGGLSPVAEAEEAEEAEGAEEAEEAAPPPLPAPAKEYLPALDIARVCGSVHVALGHLLEVDAVHSAYFFGWGFTWVPWFLMLSGYVLTHTRLQWADPSTSREGPLRYVATRLASIYPMYAAGLLLTLAYRLALRMSIPNWYEMGAQALLLVASPSSGMYSASSVSARAMSSRRLSQANKK